MSTCILSGTFKNAQGVAISGAPVVFNIEAPVIDGDSNALVPQELSTTTASDGTWSLTITRLSSGILTLDLAPNSSTPISKYKFSLVIPNTSTATFASCWADSSMFSGSSGNFPITFSSISGTLATSQLPALTSTDIWVGNGSSLATAVALSGDVTMINTGVTTVGSVGGSTAANVHAAEVLANAATSSNTASTIVKRDGSGNFTAGTITAALTGNATTATAAATATTATTATNFTGSLAGDVAGTQGATVVATVGTSTAANVHAAELLANAATNSNTGSTIVKRDISGNFTAGTITANTVITNTNIRINGASGSEYITTESLSSPSYIALDFFAGGKEAQWGLNGTAGRIFLAFGDATIGQYLYSNGTNLGFAVGTAAATWAGNTFYVDTGNSTVFTGTGIKFGVGNLTPSANLDVTGTAAISSTLAVTGRSTLTGNVGIGAAGNSTVQLDLQGTVVSPNASEYGVFARTTGSSTCTTALNGIAIGPKVAASTTLTDMYQLHVNNATLNSGSVLTNQTGLLIDALSGAGTSNVAIKTAGASNPCIFAGNVAVGSGTSPTATLEVTGTVTASSDATLGGKLIVSTTSTPASAAAAGTTGTIAWDSSFIYVCVATNTWKRVGIATW